MYNDTAGNNFDIAPIVPYTHQPKNTRNRMPWSFIMMLSGTHFLVQEIQVVLFLKETTRKL